MNVKPQVMVIDDDSVIGQSFNRVLSNNYDVDTVSSGEEAFRHLLNNKYDIIFTDIRMPGIDGFEVANHIKLHYPQTPIVFITGYGTDDNQKRAKEIGYANFVQKPLTPDMIETTTKEALQFKVPAVELDIIEETEVKETKKVSNGIGLFAKNVGLFFASPFIALGYVIALPVVGSFVIAKIAYEAYNTNK